MPAGLAPFLKSLSPLRDLIAYPLQLAFHKFDVCGWSSAGGKLDGIQPWPNPIFEHGWQIDYALPTERFPQLISKRSTLITNRMLSCCVDERLNNSIS